MNFYSAFKSFAFTQDPEFIHDLSLNIATKLPLIADLFTSTIKINTSLKINNLEWQSPIGLAAGFDKNARCIPFFQKLGFGSVEVGTVTKLPQKGNEKPRVFRIEEIDSIRNSMGFPNLGSQKIFHNLVNSNHSLPVGVNIGKNKLTDLVKTPEEYSYLYELFSPVCDYIAINISSPNTPGLRDFQQKQRLSPILEAIKEKEANCKRPIFIKISPDISLEDVKMLCELTKEFNLEGIIATNTTSNHKFNNGGLSGKYIKPYSQQIRQSICESLRETPDKTVIGVGGIDSYKEIKEFWRAGGGFVQIYTALIYKGPQLLNKIYNEMNKDIIKHDLSSVQDLYLNIKEID